jgi:hypothetical protein
MLPSPIELPMENDMKLRTLVVLAVGFLATPAFAEDCVKPAIVTGGQLAMWSHPTQVRHQAQPIQHIVVGQQMPLRPTAIAQAVKRETQVVKSGCANCRSHIPEKTALAAEPSMKSCPHGCGCARG